jgi:hypothetical protein
MCAKREAQTESMIITEILFSEEVAPVLDSLFA